MRLSLPSTLSLLVTLLCIIGCGPPEKPSQEELLKKLQEQQKAKKPKTCKKLGVALTLEGGKALNPNPQGQATPVQVRAYMLKNSQAFDELDFETLWRDGDKQLTEFLVGKPMSYTVFPGNAEIATLSLERQVNYLALMAIFREPGDSGWRVVVDLGDAHRRCKPGDLHTPVVVELDGTTMKRLDLSAQPKADEGEGSNDT